MAIEAFCGRPGAGKSYRQLRRAMELCNSQKKPLVTNVEFDYAALEKYCMKKRYYWAAAMCRNRNILVEKNFNNLVHYSHCVMFLDELGLFMNSRRSTSHFEKYFEFFLSLIYSGKNQIDMLWNAQEMDMVDINVRRFTTTYFHCINTNPNRRPGPRIRICLQFGKNGYEEYLKKPTRGTFWRNKQGVAWGFFDQTLVTAVQTFNRPDGTEKIDTLEFIQRLKEFHAANDRELAGNQARVGPGAVVVPDGFDPIAPPRLASGLGKGWVKHSGSVGSSNPEAVGDGSFPFVLDLAFPGQGVHIPGPSEADNGHAGYEISA